MRGRYIRALLSGKDRDQNLSRLFAADNAWGIAALLWLATGIWRAFGGLEKGSGFYLHNPLFWVKMGLFAVVGILEIFPMTTFIRWRIARKNGLEVGLVDAIGTLTRINHAELAIVVAIPFVASAMARGIGMGGL